MANYTVSRSSFATGHIFGYWKDWKDDEINQDINTFDGYTKSQVYIEPLFATLKQEIFESGFMSNREWDLHLTKAKQYKGT